MNDSPTEMENALANLLRVAYYNDKDFINDAIETVWKWLCDNGYDYIGELDEYLPSVSIKPEHTISFFMELLLQDDYQGYNA